MIKRDRFVKHLKQLTIFVLLLGFALGLASIFVSGITQSYFIFIGGSLVVSATLVFLFGLFMVSMESVTEAPQNYHKLKQNIHSFQTHKLY